MINRQKLFIFFSKNKLLINIIVLASIFLVVQPAFATIDWASCRVENGSTTIATSTNTKDITLNTSITDTSKAFLLLNYSGNSTVSAGQEHLTTGYIKDVNTLTFERWAATADGPSEVSYSLVECFNNEFSVQSGAINIAASAQSNTATITEVDASKSIVLVAAKANHSIDNQSFGLVLGKLNDSTTVYVERYGAPSSQATVNYQVIEFSSESNVSIQKNKIDLTTGNNSVTDTINSVVLGRTWLYCSYTAANDGLQQTSIGCELTNDTTVTAYRYDALSFDNDIQYYAVTFPTDSVIVQRGTEQDNPDTADDTEYIHEYPINSISKTTKAFPYITNTTKGTNQAYPRNKWLYLFNDTDYIASSFWRSHPTEDYDLTKHYWQVVEFKQDVPVKPSITISENADRNPDITGSTYSGSGTHNLSDWKIVTTNNCKGGVKVWHSLNNATNKTTITVNNSTGTFINDLDGQTQLAKDTVYYACVRYTNDNGDSLWSNAAAFNTNVLPVATEASISSGAASITLNPGTTKNITATATVTDNDSCQDISQVKAVLYRTSLGAAGDSDNNHRYTTTCNLDGASCTDAEDTDATYTCNFTLQYYADATDASSPQPSDDWTVQITPEDEIDKGTADTDNIEMDSITALQLSGSVDYGLLSLGTDTGTTNQIITIENHGNINIDINLSGYGESPGDSKAMICETGALDNAQQKYSMSGFTYSSGGSAVPINSTEVNFNLNKSTGSASTKNLYFGLGIPSVGLGGTCTGTVVITAVADANID